MIIARHREDFGYCLISSVFFRKGAGDIIVLAINSFAMILEVDAQRALGSDGLRRLLQCKKIRFELMRDDQPVDWWTTSLRTI